MASVRSHVVDADVAVAPRELTLHAVPENRPHEDHERRRGVEGAHLSRVDDPAHLAVPRREDAQPLLPDPGRSPRVVLARALIGGEVEGHAGDIAVRLDEAAGAPDVVALGTAGVDEVPADEA